MSATRITELPAATTAGATDLLVIVTDPSSLPATKKVTVNTIATKVINDYNLVKTKSSNVVNVISNNYVQLQYNANTNASDSDTAGSIWTYVNSSEIGMEAYDVSDTLKSSLHVNLDGSIVAFGNVVLSGTSVPANSTAVGVRGQTAWDTNYFYVCVQTNTWKRAALNTW